MKKILLALGLMIGITQSSLTAAYDCCETDCCIDWCDGWTIYGDYLYWNVRKCNLDYAVRTIEHEFDSEEVELPFPTGKIQAVSPNYTSGFRVGASKTFCNWDLGVRYTYLRTDDKDSFNTAGNDDEAAPTRLLFGIFEDDLLTAEARYEVDLDVFDIEFGHEYQPWCNTFLRFFGGFKLARIDQKFHVDMEGEDFTDTDAFILQKSSIDMDAYGLYIGAHGTHNFWDFCGAGKLGLFGDFSIGGLVGDIDRKLESTGRIDNEFLTVTHIHDSCWRLVGNLNIAAGLSYMLSDCFCGNVTLSVGYEMNLWLNTADFLGMNLTTVPTVIEDSNPEPTTEFSPNFSTVRNQDTLGFDGLVVRAAIDF